MIISAIKNVSFYFILLKTRNGNFQLVSLTEANNKKLRKKLYPAPKEKLIYRRHPFDPKRIIGVRHFHDTVCAEKRQDFAHLFRYHWPPSGCNISNNEAPRLYEWSNNEYMIHYFVFADRSLGAKSISWDKFHSWNKVYKTPDSLQADLLDSEVFWNSHHYSLRSVRPSP